MLQNTIKTKVTYHILLADAKTHLNIEDDFTDDDSYITQLIKDSTQEAENYVDSDIAKTTNVFEYYDFYGSQVTLDGVPTISVESITYLDSAGDSQTVTLADCTIKKGVQVTEIVFPDADYIDTDKLTVNYTSGYEDSTTVPASIHRAILMKIGDFYDVQRGSMVSGAFKDSGAFERALNSFKKISY